MVGLVRLFGFVDLVRLFGFFGWFVGLVKLFRFVDLLVWFGCLGLLDRFCCVVNGLLFGYLSVGLVGLFCFVG